MGGSETNWRVAVASIIFQSSRSGRTPRLPPHHPPDPLPPVQKNPSSGKCKQRRVSGAIGDKRRGDGPRGQRATAKSRQADGKWREVAQASRLLQLPPDGAERRWQSLLPLLLFFKILPCRGRPEENLELIPIKFDWVSGEPGFDLNELGFIGVGRYAGNWRCCQRSHLNERVGCFVLQHANNVRRWAVAYKEKMEQRRLQKQLEEEQEQRAEADAAPGDEGPSAGEGGPSPGSGSSSGRSSTTGGEGQQRRRYRHGRHPSNAQFDIPDRDVLYRLEVITLSFPAIIWSFRANFALAAWCVASASFKCRWLGLTFGPALSPSLSRSCQRKCWLHFSDEFLILRDGRYANEPVPFSCSEQDVMNLCLIVSPVAAAVATAWNCCMQMSWIADEFDSFNLDGWFTVCYLHLNISD